MDEEMLLQTDLTIQTHPWYHQDHHDGDTFTNIWDPPHDAPVHKGGLWIIQHALQRKRNVPPPVQPVDPETLSDAPGRLRVTWIGHATALIQLPAHNLLTDPIFTRRASPVSFAGPERIPALPLQIADLPAIDFVLISHNHYDHLDEASVRALDTQFAPCFLVPLGVGKTLRDWGVGCVLELDWWQYVEVDGLRFHSTPAKHFSGRSLFDRNATLWVSWYLEAPGDDLRLYYSGDTAYASHFKAIRQRLGAPDVALLSIGAYLPRWFMAPVHMDPQEAVQAFLDLQATHLIPVHWGTFDLADEPIQEAAEQVRQYAAAQGVEHAYHVLDIGGRFIPEAVRPSTNP